MIFRSPRAGKVQTANVTSVDKAMPVYTVHEPPLRADEEAADANRFVFVRDGFHVWAFLLTPLWMLWHRLWLVLVLYLVLVGGLQWATVALGGSLATAFAVGVLVSLLAGFEAGTLRRWTLARRGWKNVGVVTGDDAEAAERRFFDSWVAAGAMPLGPPPAASGVSAPPAVRAPQGPEVIGLFPQPGARR
jgi:hypothetical protein